MHRKAIMAAWGLAWCGFGVIAAIVMFAFIEPTLENGVDVSLRKAVQVEPNETSVGVAMAPLVGSYFVFASVNENGVGKEWRGFYWVLVVLGVVPTFMSAVLVNDPVNGVLVMMLVGYMVLGGARWCTNIVGRS